MGYPEYIVSDPCIGYRFRIPKGVASSFQRSSKALPSSPASAPSEAGLTQASYWKALEKFLRPGDVIIADIGTSNAGATEMRLPPGCSFLNQQVFGSIG